MSSVSWGAALGLALGFALGKPMSAVLIGVESWDALVALTVVMILGLTYTVDGASAGHEGSTRRSGGRAASGVSSAGRANS